MKKDSEWKKKADEIKLNKFVDPKDFRMPNLGK